MAVEDAAGTDALLERVATLRGAGKIAEAGGVLVKCLKPQQDGRHDVPTIGPATAERAERAGLAGVAAEAGRTMLVGRDETIDAFRPRRAVPARLEAADSATWLSAPLRFALVVGEESGDQLGAGLIDAIRRRRPDATFVGLAGERMQARGMRASFRSPTWR